MKLSLLLLSLVLASVHGQLPLASQSPLGLPPFAFHTTSASRAATPDPPIPNCPFHPVPEALSASSLPDGIKTAMNEALELLKTSILNKENLPGIAYSVTYEGKTLGIGGLGVKDKTKPGIPDADTIFRIGSVSKVFATLVLYQLFDRGMVKSLDDDITNYCPDFKMQTEYNTTLRQLASQLSGLPREAPCESSNITNFCDTTTKAVLTSLHSQRTLFPPWTRPSYSNLAYALLGHCLVEHLYPTMTYEEYVQKNILGPLNMTSTGFNITAAVKARMAVGYNVDGSVAPLSDLGWIGPAGQMYSTLNDLNKFTVFFLDGNPSILSPSVRQQMLLPVFINRDQKTGFGTPWEVLFESNYTILTKGGNVLGYSALFSFVPELKLGVSVLMSGAADEFKVGQIGYNLFIPAFVEALTKLQQPFPYPPTPSIYEGTYSLGLPNVPNITIATYDKQLVVNILGTGYYLAYRDKLLLQIEFDDSLLPCLNEQLLATKGEWLYFDPVNGKGVSPKFTIPGVFTGITFTRVA